MHAEQSKLRGSILYNDGERPEFLSCNNIPVDDDNLDYGSYHLLQLYRDEVIGGLRLTPINQILPEKNFLSTFTSKTGIETISEYFNNKKIFASTRLFIRPQNRIQENIISIYTGMWFVSTSLIQSDVTICALSVKRKYD